MTNDWIEAALRDEIPTDEHSYAARSIPATIEGARAELDAPRGTSLAVMLGAVVVLALVAVVGWAAWRMGASDVGAEVSAPTTVPSPLASGAAQATCGAGDFLTSSDPWGGAAGSRGTDIVLRVRDTTSSCVMPQVIQARIVAFGDTALVTGSTTPIARTEMHAGAAIDGVVTWSNWCGPDPDAPRLELGIGGEWVQIDEPGSAVAVPPCLGEAEASALNIILSAP